MGITLELQQVTEEDDGTYTVTINALRDNGDIIISGKTFSCTNAANLKTAIKPKFERLIAIEQKNEQIRTLAQGVLDEIINEVTQ